MIYIFFFHRRATVSVTSLVCYDTQYGIKVNDGMETEQDKNFDLCLQVV